MTRFVIETGSPLEYVYSYTGGAYVDVFRNGNSVPFDVINVWNYANGARNFETLGQLKELIEAYEAERQEQMDNF